MLIYAGETFVSLNNTDWVVTLGFIVFIGILLYYRVPNMIGARLDKRTEDIRRELDEARALREEAQALLASFERKQKEVADHSASIVSAAKADAEAAAEQAKKDLEVSIARRLRAAEEQIASAEKAAVREVKDRAAAVAIAAATRVISERLDGAEADAMIDRSIETVANRLN